MNYKTSISYDNIKPHHKLIKTLQEADIHIYTFGKIREIPGQIVANSWYEDCR